MATANPWDNQTAQIAVPKLAQPGLISSTSTAAASPIVAGGYDPTKTTLNPATDTVQGQIKSIINENSPLMQQAQAGAMQQMNSRGLINTSINTGAAQGAVIAAATPIAQQDANIYSTVNREGTAAVNAADQFGAAARNTASSQNAQLGTNVELANAEALNRAAATNAAAVQQASLTNADFENKASQFNASQSNDLTKLGMDINNKQALANTEASFKTLMQGNQSASEIYKQATKNITDVMSNKDMGQEAKDVAVSNQIAMLRKGLEITGALTNLNLSQYLDFSGVPT